MSGPDATISATRALCNACGRLGDAQVVFRGDRVFLVKWCPEHGFTEVLVSSDREYYLRSLSCVKPGTRPRERAVAAHGECPDSCGLCPAHEQHTCVPILEITGRCDLRCPVCLVADADIPELTVAEIRGILDGLVRAEGRLNMLTLSGGEPTAHPDFLSIVDECRRPEVGLLSVSTDGLRLSRDDGLLREVCARGVVISLQFDGVRPETYAVLRGRADLAALKLKLLDRVAAFGGRTSLTVTLARGVNEAELTAILDLLFSREEVLSVMVQPLARAGRAAAFGDASDALTIPDAIRLLAASSRGVLAESDFTPLPCSHPSCFALTYLLKAGDGSLVPLPRVFDAAGYLDIIRNQALFGTDAETLARIRDELYRLWSSDGIVPDREKVLAAVRAILTDLSRLGPGASHRELIDLGTRTVKSVFVHAFMDRATFDLSRAVKCCNHYPQKDGRLVPACVRNVLRRAPGGRP